MFRQDALQPKGLIIAENLEEMVKKFWIHFPSIFQNEEIKFTRVRIS